MPPKRTKIEETEEEPDASSKSKRTRQSLKPEPIEVKLEPKINERQTRQKQKIEESQYYEDFFDIICSFQDENQRYLANIFYVLPSKDDYPDYYELIKKPIDLNTIAKNILNSNYKSIKQLDTDLTLMFDNAKRYNDPKSQIYKDACRLRKLTKDTCKDLIELQSKHKLPESKKSRDKKLKLLEEISEMFDGIVEEKQPEPVEPGSESDEDESEDEEPQDEDDTKTPKRTKFNQKLINLMWSLFDYIKEYKFKNVSIIEPFMKLPSKRLYPDYYEEIKNPVAMNVIKKKLNKRLYKSFKDLQNDFELMFENAMSYNLEESLIYQNAVRLVQASRSKCKELEAGYSSLLNEKINLVSPGTPPIRGKKRDIPKNDPTPKFLDLKEKMIYLYNIVNDVEIDGRQLAPPFRHLPSKTDYPDYYNVIKKPIDMTKIWAKINHVSNSYQSLEDMCADFTLMFENASIYNEPASVLYKDALSLQKVLYTKRDEMEEDESLTPTFVRDQTTGIIRDLFDQVEKYRDQDGRCLSDTFTQIYHNFNLKEIKTLGKVKSKLNEYVRLDTFQHDLFQVFDFMRQNTNKHSQVFKDSYELQRVYILKRDELCRNGEVFMSNALNYKTTALDSYITQVMGTSSHNLDEAEVLGVERLYKPLELELKQDNTPGVPNDFDIGGFYEISGRLVCCLAKNESKIIGQVYFRPQESEFLRTVKVFKNEVFKSDKYLIIDATEGRPVCITSLKEYTLNEPKFDPKKIYTQDDGVVHKIKQEDIYICESIYSTENEFVRKINFKKWSPLQFIGSTSPRCVSYNFDWVKRATPLVVERCYLNEVYVKDLVNEINTKFEQSFNDLEIRTIQFESVPSYLKTDTEEDGVADNEDPDASAKYYEQIVHKNTFYKLGDYVYIKHQVLHSNQLILEKNPLILRVDRIWSVNETDFMFRGPVFLRPVDIPHEPTRVFFKNEVFREITRDLTVGVDQVIEDKKCVVMNPKAYSISRVTQVDENDVYVCENKYNLASKTFRKFTKGLKKFELSLKCCEDEVFFMRKELVLRKHLSPFLRDLKIDYEAESSEYLKNFNLEEEDEWSGEMKDDDNSNPIEQKRKYAKRTKKIGFTLFTRELRKVITDSKELVLKWKGLSDRDRQSYEDRAIAESEPKSSQVIPPVRVPSPKPVFTQPVVPVQVPIEPVKPVETVRQVMHKEAYVRYIANLRRMQQINSTGAINNPGVNVFLTRSSDWYNGIDITGSRVKETKVQNLPNAWIENTKSNEVLQNLMSLRYYLLQDAVTIEKECVDESVDVQDDGQVEASEIVNEQEQVSLTVL